MKTFKLTINEDELAALIEYHAQMLFHDPSIENAARVHDLTKRLTKKDEVEIVKDEPEKEIPITRDPTGNGWL